MGRGNVCVLGEAEGLYYISNDFLNMYSRYVEDGDFWESIPQGEYYDLPEREQSEWTFDGDATSEELRFLLENVEDRFRKKYKSFTPCDEWITRERRAFLESNLFYIAVEDNQWSIAIELIQKDDPWEFYGNLQKRHYKSYLNALKEILLELCGEVGTYTGAWTHGVVKAE